MTMRLFLPLLGIFILLGAWQFIVEVNQIPPYILPAPSAIALALYDNFGTLMHALWISLSITLQALFWAFIGGGAIAILFTRLRFIEQMFTPLLVTLQVTPVIAIAPLILIWVGFDHVNRALVIIAWIVAFFPIVTNMIAGIRAVPPALYDLFALSHARPWQVLLYLELPTALPHILTGAKIASGLALIGAVVAEFVAGSGAGGGLAWRIIEAGNRLEIALMFAALLLLSLMGVCLFYGFRVIEWLALHRWHDSFYNK